VHRTELRLDLARRECPRVLLWTAIIVIVISALTYVQMPYQNAFIHAIDAGVALLLVILSVVLGRPTVPAALVPWGFALGVVALQVAFVYEVHVEQDPIVFAYLIIVMAGFGPTTLAWRPFLAGSAVMLAAISALVFTWDEGRGAEWVIVSITSLVVSALLLFTRLRSVDSLADASELARRLAVTDELTDLDNRHGLHSHLPRLLAMARRTGASIFVTFIDIDGLKLANDRHGHTFGDEVIQTAAQAVLGSVRGGDLVARWGGDEIIVVGIGSHPDPEAFSRRLDQQVTALGIDRDRWPGHLSVGFAQGDPERVSVDELIESADADMYGRRGAR
jgi:diguanylate cyclase (GGDEF)-like protein